MTTKYGFELADWDAAKEEMRQALIQTAKRKDTIPYSELVEQVESIRLEPDAFALAHMLGEISTSEHSEGRGMLTVLVVHKDGDKQPGPGFFELAKQLGRDTSDSVICWVNELNTVHEYWSRQCD